MVPGERPQPLVLASVQNVRKIVVEEAVVELNHLSQSRVFNVRVVDKLGAKVAVAIWTGEQRPNELNIG